MISSKLSGRRRAARKPPVCLSKPPVIVPPPPPPPEWPDWAPETFTVDISYNGPVNGMPGRTFGPFTCDRTDTPLLYDGTGYSYDHSCTLDLTLSEDATQTTFEGDILVPAGPFHFGPDTGPNDGPPGYRRYAINVMANGYPCIIDASAP